MNGPKRPAPHAPQNNAAPEEACAADLSMTTMAVGEPPVVDTDAPSESLLAPHTPSRRHTPGPWLYRRDSKASTDATIYALTSTGNPRYIARVYGEGVLSTRIEERDANLALIAAAPVMKAQQDELLEALKDARKELAFLHDLHVTPRQLDKLVSRLDATISKIEAPPIDTAVSLQVRHAGQHEVAQRAEEREARIAELEEAAHAALHSLKCQDTSLTEYELRKALRLPPAE